MSRPLSYAFWSNVKQNGYDSGRTSIPFFIAECSGDANKEVDFVESHVQSLIKSDKDSANKRVNELKEIISDKQEKLKLLESEKNFKLDKKLNDYNQKKTEKDNELKQIKGSYDSLSKNFINQLTKANETVNGLANKITTYAEESEKYWKAQSENVKKEWTKLSTNGKRIVGGEIKNLLVNGINCEVFKSDNNKISYAGDLFAFMFLILICIYDIYFGENLLEKVLVESSAVWKWFLAILFVPIIIGSVHYLSKIFMSKATSQKVFGVASLLCILLVVLLYVFQSLPSNVKGLFGNFGIWGLIMQNIIAGKSGMEFVFRALMIPSILVGEIIIETTNWNNISAFFGKYIKLGKYMSKLVANGLLALNDRKLSIRLKDVKAEIAKNVEEIKNESTPDFSKIQEDIINLKDDINPIYNVVSGEKGLYEKEIEKIKSDLSKLKSIYDNDVSDINKSYKPQLDELNSEIKDYTKEMDKLNSWILTMERQARSGFMRGLAG